MGCNGKNSTTERGAALVECALSLPVLIFFVSAILEFGNVLSQLTWFSQAAYHVISVGSQSPQSAGPSLMDSRYAQLVLAKSPERSYGRIDLHTPQAASAAGYYDNTPTIRTITVRMTADIRPLGNTPLSFPLSYELTAPQLLNDSVSPGSLSSFGNPSPSYYRCNLTSCGGSTPCAAACRPNCVRDISTLGREICS